MRPTQALQARVGSRAQPLRFVSRLAGADVAGLAISIDIEQPLIDSMYEMWRALAAAHADEITAWAVAPVYTVFDVVDRSDDERARKLRLDGPDEETVYAVPVDDAEERGFSTAGCNLTVFADGDAVFLVNLNGVEQSLWTQSVFHFRHLVAN